MQLPGLLFRAQSVYKFIIEKKSGIKSQADNILIRTGFNAWDYMSYDIAHPPPLRGVPLTKGGKGNNRR